MSSPIRVGLLGASSIARKVWASIVKSGLVVTRVASRNPEATESFIVDCCNALDIPISEKPQTSTYDDLVRCAEVDVVYISIPVMKRHEWVMKCVENGKHVIGEKPPAENATVLREWMEKLHAKQLLYMDGTMLSHGPWIEKLMETLPRCGKVRRITSSFTWCADEERRRTDIRFDPKLENLGALGDCGWYCVRAMLHVMGFRMPTSAIGRIIETNPKGAIVAFSGELTFDVKGETVTGYLYCAFDSAAQAEFTVSGTHAIMESPNLYNPITHPPGPAGFTLLDAATTVEGTKLTVRREEERIAVPAEDGSVQGVQMWRHIADALQRTDGGALTASAEAMQKWGRMAWITQRVLDALLQAALAQPTA